LRGRRRAAMGEPDDGPDGNVGPDEDRDRPPHVDRANADRRDVVLGREMATLLDERVVQFRAKQRVVDRFRDLALGKAGDSERHARHTTSGRRTSRARRKPRLTRSSLPSNERSSCSIEIAAWKPTE